jgi:aspartate racemase
MATNTRKTIGILGGMGPEATVDLFHRIVGATPAACDQEHLHIVVDNDPSVPDRTEAILSANTEPVVEKLTAMARRLEAAGADFLVVPCNTAHYFLDRVRPAVSVPFLDMIGETVDAILQRHPGTRRVGLLATTGALRTRLYHDRCASAGLSVVEPNEDSQQAVMAAIHAVKSAGADAKAAGALERAAAELVTAGAEVVIAGCTEIPLALEPEKVSVPLINPTEELARAAVRMALGADS